MWRGCWWFDGAARRWSEGGNLECSRKPKWLRLLRWGERARGRVLMARLGSREVGGKRLPPV